MAVNRDLARVVTTFPFAAPYLHVESRKKYINENLDEDTGETRDLASEKPALAARLRRELAAWRRSVGAQMMSANPDFDPARPNSREGKQ